MTLIYKAGCHSAAIILAQNEGMSRSLGLKKRAVFILAEMAMFLIEQKRQHTQRNRQYEADDANG